jgi:hypothetical protein
MVKHPSTRVPFFWHADPSQVIVPSENDVLCGRGLVAFRHVGNQRLRVLVAQVLPLFATTTCRHEKTRLVRSLVLKVLDRGGRFLKRLPNTNVWYLAGFDSAREKVSHALRDATSDKVKCMRGLVLTSMWDTTVRCDEKFPEASVQRTGQEQEFALNVTKSRLTTALSADSGTDVSFNQFDVDTMLMLNMMTAALTAKDFARSIDMRMTFDALVETAPECIAPLRETDLPEDFADLDPDFADISESLEGLSELSCADLGWR